MRQLALLLFRNTITLSVKLEDALARAHARVPPAIVQMLLVLQVGGGALVGARPGEHQRWSPRQGRDMGPRDGAFVREPGVLQVPESEWAGVPSCAGSPTCSKLRLPSAEAFQPAWPGLQPRRQHLCRDHVGSRGDPAPGRLPRPPVGTAP